MAQRIQSGMQHVTGLKPHERDSFKAAQTLLEKPGIPLYAAVEDYVRARTLAGSESLSVMATEYGKMFGKIVRRATVPEVVAELLKIRSAKAMACMGMSCPCPPRQLTGRKTPDRSGPSRAETADPADANCGCRSKFRGLRYCPRQCGDAGFKGELPKNRLAPRWAISVSNKPSIRPMPQMIQIIGTSQPTTSASHGASAKSFSLRVSAD